MGRFVLEQADLGDDSDLRRILSSNIIEGEIQLSLEKNPSFFEAIKIRGKYNQIIVAKEKEANRVVGFGTRSIRPAYLNGELHNVGYLGDLRIEPEFQGLNLLSRGYKYLQKCHSQDKKTLIYLTTITEKNVYALDILTAKRANLPAYYYYGDYCTFVVFLSPRKRFFNHKFNVVKGSDRYLDDIVQFLQEKGKKRQFYSFYTKSDFLQDDYLKNFSITDFYLVIKDNKIIGLAGRWDQLEFKQTVIKGYKGKMKWLRSFYNMILKNRGLPLLPPLASVLNSFYIAFIAIANDDWEILYSLLAYIYDESKESNYSYFLVGLHNRDHLAKAVLRFPHIKYLSKLYIVCWQDGERLFSSLDDRIPYIELATL